MSSVAIEKKKNKKKWNSKKQRVKYVEKRESIVLTNCVQNYWVIRLIKLIYVFQE